MKNVFLILGGRSISLLSKLLNLGHGSTWPGHIILKFNKNFIKNLIKKNPKLIIILIAGTNGKTTTSRLIQIILEKNHKKVFKNESGANLLNGIASTIALHSTVVCALKYDYAIFEVDENTLPLVLKELTPDYLIAINLFRDQLDRYGEVDAIARKWKEALKSLPQNSTLILNADDPLVATIGKESKAKEVYFGLKEKEDSQELYQHAADSAYCPNCQSKLTYKLRFFSHLGEWKCDNCGLKRPEINLSSAPVYPLAGVYNKYNMLAAALFAKINNIGSGTIEQSLKNFTPAFGRQEIINIDGKKIQLFLSKNPTSFNESLRTVKDLQGKNILLVLNDRIPDGKDVSWIWDTDIESLIDSFQTITISGDRCYDMGLRLKYAFNKNQRSKIKNQ
ncbi:MAG: MurT ligase domain-containing protein, partial [bacterium]|nr:MurT ligase domain-containing protein [bacterium]